MKKILYIFLPILFITNTAEASFDKNLYYGLQKDSQVTALQEFLTDKGYYSGPISGNFFSLTLSGVKKFQTANGIIPVSGYFGSLSRGVANTQLETIAPEEETGQPTAIIPTPTQVVPQVQVITPVITQPTNVPMPTLGSSEPTPAKPRFSGIQIIDGVLTVTSDKHLNLQATAFPQGVSISKVLFDDSNRSADMSEGANKFIGENRGAMSTVYSYRTELSGVQTGTEIEITFTDTDGQTGTLSVTPR